MPKDPNRSPTIRDLAKALGVSKSTVHYALQNNPKLATRTRLKVQAAAARLGYRHNPVVSALTHELRRGREAHMRENICYLISHDVDVRTWEKFGWGDFVKGARKRAHDLGFNLEVFQRPGQAIKSLRRVLEARGIRGILVAPLPGGASELDFQWSRFASVTLGYQMLSPQLHSVHCEHLDVMRTALIEVEKRGYKRMGLVTNDEACRFDKRTMLAEFFLENGPLGKKSDLPPLVFHLADLMSARKNFTRWFQKYKPDVVLTIDWHVHDWLKDLGLRIPEDVGFLHLAVTPYDPHFSGLDNREEIIGASAAQLLISNLIINEIGIPKIPICQLIEPIWQEGETLRKAMQIAVRSSPNVSVLSAQLATEI